MGFFDRLGRTLGALVDDAVVPDEVRALVTGGRAAFEREDYGEAIRLLGQAIEQRREQPRVAFLLGLAHLRSGQPELAVRLLAASAELRPSLETLAALGEAELGRGQPLAAIQAFRRALADCGEDPEERSDLLRSLGSAYLAAGEVGRAVRELRKAAAGWPQNLAAHGLLGLALLRRGDAATARVALERACAAELADPELLRALGRAHLQVGDRAAARAAFERVTRLAPDDAAALSGLAELDAAQGDLAQAHARVLRAMGQEALEPARRAALHVQLAGLQRRSGDLEAAVTSLECAAQVAGEGDRLLDAGGRPVLSLASELAIEAGRTADAARLAERVLAFAPGDAAALAAVGLAALAEVDKQVAKGGRVDGPALLRARTSFERSLRSGENVHARLGLGRALLLAGQTAAAIAALRPALATSGVGGAGGPGSGGAEQARALLAAAYRQSIPAGADLDALLTHLHRHLLGEPLLAGLAPQAGRLVETLDRPLLVAVMGEFNSGKSTFVNALLGEAVAPMGITPTTATINLLRYGRERRGRISYRDDRARDVAWPEVAAVLAGLGAEEARAVRLVEVLYPAEELLRVNIVDTPGFNSILPEHEETAREFIGQADAVVWLFAVGQAGKQTERQALERIRAQGRRVLGVLNKVDTVPAAEGEAIAGYLRQHLGDLLEELVETSAREALEGEALGDPARVQGSRLPRVRAVLEQRFYSRSRAIKRQVAASKLQALLAAAEQMMAQAGQRLSDYQSLLEAASASLCADRFLFAREFLPAERLRLHQALFDLYREAAREVLDFVRPRRWPFGSHQASSADRDFLLDLIEEQLGQLVGGSLGRLVAEISRILAAVSDSQRAAPAGIEWPLAGRLAGQLAEAAATEQTRAGVSAAWRRSLEEQVYARYLAFARGTLRGGRVDDFFVRRLPQLELSEEAVTRALLRDAVDVDEELVPPLGAFVERLLGEEVERMANQVQAVGAAACDLEQRALTPVRAVVAAITGERPGATTSAIDRDAAPPPQSPRSPPPAAEQR